MLVFGNVALSVKCILFWSTSGMNGFVLIHRRNLYLMHPVKDKRPQTQEEFVAVFVASSLWSPKSYPTKNRVYTYKGLSIPPASPSGRISIASCMLCAMLSLSKAKKIGEASESGPRAHGPKARRAHGPTGPEPCGPKRAWAHGPEGPRSRAKGWLLHFYYCYYYYYYY